MTTYGIVKDHYYAGDGTLQVKVRIPSVHGAYSQKEYKGKIPKNYVLDQDLPYIAACLLPHLPKEGEIVAVTSLDDGNTQFLILGLTGGSIHHMQEPPPGSGWGEWRRR